MSRFTGAAPFLTQFAIVEEGESEGPIVLEGLALPWGQTVPLNWFGDTVSFRAGSVLPPIPERVKFLLDHRAKPFGYLTAAEARTDGLWATVAVPRAELADPEVAAAVRQLGNGVRDALSVGVEIVTADETVEGEGWDATTHFDVTEGQLLELSSVVIPRFADARVARVAANHLTANHPSNRREPMPTALRPVAATVPGPEPDPDPNPDDPGEPDEDARLDAHRRATVRAGRGVYRYADFGELLRASIRGELTERHPISGGAILRAAFVDTITSDVPGLVPPGELARIFDLIARNQQLADAAAPVGLPDTGMTIGYPQVTARPSVGFQAAEKTDITSVQTTVAHATAPVVTLAGGEDVSIQVILRSDPSYVQLMGELYAEAMAIATDIYAIQVYDAAVPALHKVSIGTAATGWITALFNLAGLILKDSGALPDQLVISSDMWIKFGGAVDPDGRPLFTNRSPMNPAGSVSLTSTSGEIRDLSFKVDPNFAADRGRLFYSGGFRSALGPVQTMTADVPAKLGRDYAVFRFGAFLPVMPKALGLFATGTAPTADETTTTTSGKASKSA